MSNYSPLGGVKYYCAKIVPLLVVCLLPACATIVSDESQSVSVSTCDVTGAQCELVNKEGKTFVSSTPGSVTVQNSSSSLIVTCRKEGYQPGTSTMTRSHKGSTWGNVLAGGLIGYAVDRGTGAAFRYNSDVNICLTKDPEAKVSLVPPK